MSLIAFILLLVASLALCGLSSFKLKRESLLSFIGIKGVASLSIFIFAIVAMTLSQTLSLSGLFILIALAVQILSSVVSNLPTRDDLFAPLYLSLDLTTSALLALSGLLLVSLSPFGLPIGLVVGIITSIIFILLKQKKFNWKTDLPRFGFFAFAAAMLAEIPVILIASVSLKTILFALGALIFFAYSILKTFIQSDKTSIALTQNILYYLSLITIAASLFM